VDNNNNDLETADFLKEKKDLEKLAADIAETKAQLNALLSDVNSMLNELE